MVAAQVDVEELHRARLGVLEQLRDGGVRFGGAQGQGAEADASALETTSMSWRVYRMWSQATPLTMVYSGMPFFSATSTVEVGQALRWMTVLIPASLAWQSVRRRVHPRRPR